MIRREVFIKKSERGLLFYRGDLRQILTPGTHHFVNVRKRYEVSSYSLINPMFQHSELPMWLQYHRELLEAHCHIVSTSATEAAVAFVNERPFIIRPNEQALFWKAAGKFELYLSDLTADLALPSELISRLWDVPMADIYKTELLEDELGLLYVDDNMVRPLAPGRHLFWTIGHQVRVPSYRHSEMLIPFSKEQEDVLIAHHAEFVSNYTQVVELQKDEVALVRHRSKLISIQEPMSRKLFWQGVAVERLNIAEDMQLSQELVKELLADQMLLASLTRKTHFFQVPGQHVGLVHIDGILQAPLTPGVYAWWTFGHNIATTTLDTRLQMLDVAGQEILTRDKLPLRINLTAGYRVTDAVRAMENLKDIKDYVYKELQFGLRSAVGTRNLEQLLEDKSAIDEGVSSYIKEKTADYGLDVLSVGVKDIIVPGEVRAILTQVVEAEKTAQANNIRRREETAATRSLLNTAKVMEDNPVALRLKELEVLERVTERIETLNVYGGLDGVMRELVTLKPSN